MSLSFFYKVKGDYWGIAPRMIILLYNSVKSYYLWKREFFFTNLTVANKVADKLVKENSLFHNGANWETPYSRLLFS